MVGEKVYYLGTTLYDENISYFKILYWKRWKVETHFRHSKYCLSLRELKSKTINGIRQDICVHNFIFIINSFFKHSLQLEVDERYTINTASSLFMTINELLYPLIFKKITDVTINEILQILNTYKKALIPIRNNRNYERRKKRPHTKWCQKR